MNAIPALADRVASLVPGVIPARSAAAKTCFDYCSGSSCNAGDYFVPLKWKYCYTTTSYSAHFIGCCG